MAVSYINKKIGKGINLSCVNDNKFKSDLISFRFITRIDERESPINSLLSSLLAMSNKNIRSRSELNKKMISLYDTNLRGFSYTIGDYHCIGLSVRFIDDNYALDNEKISVEATKVLLDCIFEPDIENGKLSEKYYKLCKNELIETIMSEINDRRGYAALRASTFMYQNEPAAIYENGTVEQVEAITQDDLINAYHKILTSAYIDVTVAGSGNTFDAEQMLIDRLNKIDGREDVQIDFNSPSPVKSECMNVTEQYDVTQCKMIMAFKTECDDFYANKLMCALYGGTAFSKLFSNVREKMSLCYDCASSIVECKNTMVVESGISKENIDRAREEIERQLLSIADGDFTDEQLENTKKSLYNGFRSNYDRIAALNSWYFIQRVRGGDKSPDEVNQMISDISRERVIEAAKSFKLDTVYVMEPEVNA